MMAQETDTTPRKDDTSVHVQVSADVDHRATLSPGVTIWHLAQVREWAELGRDCMVGRGAFIGAGVRMGDGCKVQNHALVYEPATLGDGVFVGPAAVFTNDHFPRAITPEGKVKGFDDWDPVRVTVQTGASIARGVCFAPVLGAWAMVAAGAVVTTDVPDHALVEGVPARQVGRAGQRLTSAGEHRWRCSATNEIYHETEHGLVLLSPIPSGAPDA
jgi:UDP-2-acetamido-3-amino-2,3-dideoxy-glucuronate N-acetyltransferase